MEGGSPKKPTRDYAFSHIAAMKKDAEKTRKAKEEEEKIPRYESDVGVSHFFGNQRERNAYAEAANITLRERERDRSVEIPMTSEYGATLLPGFRSRSSAAGGSSSKFTERRDENRAPHNIGDDILPRRVGTSMTSKPRPPWLSAFRSPPRGVETSSSKSMERRDGARGQNIIPYSEERSLPIVPRPLGTLSSNLLEIGKSCLLGPPTTLGQCFSTIQQLQQKKEKQIPIGRLGPDQIALREECERLQKNEGQNEKRNYREHEKAVESYHGPTSFTFLGPSLGTNCFVNPFDITDDEEESRGMSFVDRGPGSANCPLQRKVEGEVRKENEWNISLAEKHDSAIIRDAAYWEEIDRIILETERREREIKKKKKLQKLADEEKKKLQKLADEEKKKLRKLEAEEKKKLRKVEAEQKKKLRKLEDKPTSGVSSALTSVKNFLEKFEFKRKSAASFSRDNGGLSQPQQKDILSEKCVELSPKDKTSAEPQVSKGSDRREEVAEGQPPQQEDISSEKCVELSREDKTNAAPKLPEESDRREQAKEVQPSLEQDISSEKCVELSVKDKTSAEPEVCQESDRREEAEKAQPPQERQEEHAMRNNALVRKKATIVSKRVTMTIAEAEAWHIQHRLGAETSEETLKRLKEVPGSMAWHAQNSQAARVLRHSTSSALVKASTENRIAAITDNRRLATSDSEEDPEERRKRLQREKKQKQRAKQSDEKKKQIQAVDTAKHAERRENALIRKAEATAKALARQLETPQQMENRLAAAATALVKASTENRIATITDNRRLATSDSEEDPEERRKRLQREKKQKQRAKQSNEKKKQIQALDTAKHAERRENALIRKAEVSAKALARQLETPQQSQERRLVDATSHAIARQLETPQQSQERRLVDATSHAIARQLETPQQSQERRLVDATSHAIARQLETPQQSQERRLVDATSHAIARQLETPQQTENRLAAAATASALARQLETPQQSQERRLVDATSHTIARQLETQQQTEERRKAALANYHNRQNEAQNREIKAVQEIMGRLNGSAADGDGEGVVGEYHCGPMNVKCQFCGSYNFAGEKPSDGKFTKCCRKGTVNIPQARDDGGNLLEYPPFLQSLLSNPQDVNYRNFREYIRSYNSSLSFASMGAKLADVPGRGPYVFKCNAQMYHRTSHTEPKDGQARQYAQLYILDSTQATEVRLAHPANHGLNQQILYQIDRFFREHNRLTKTYLMMREVERAEAIKARQENRTVPVVSIVMRQDRSADERRYNLPTSNEVAMVFVDEDGEPPFERDIRIYKKNPVNENYMFINLSILSANLDPMTYAILFPYGTPGWHRQFICSGYNDPRPKHISILQYKAYLTAIRDRFNSVMSAGNLTQQWIVDSYLQVEANNLHFIRNNQTKLRRDQYQGLADYIAAKAAKAGVTPGLPLILPSTFEGSPRNMHERCSDAMAIFAKYGSVDLFVTFTANPAWPEITKNLRPGESAADRPDLIARVFTLKLKEFIRDLTHNKVLGRDVAHVYTIEFQKRGLPHAHILIVLLEADKFKTAERIDEIVCAEIPDPVEYPKLYEIVTKSMLHGPCGDVYPNARCMEDGKCTKKFPHEYSPLNASGYPKYRRRIGQTFVKQGKRLDNRWVVPYNKYLLLKYNAHINVEVCTSMRAVKYIYKYIYKGFDCAKVQVNDVNQEVYIHDEVRNYLDTRYVCAPEAMWRLLENPMHGRSHAVIHLPVHLDQQQVIQFTEGREEEALAEAAGGNTKLTAWFALNRNSTEAKHLLYTQIPYEYTFKNGAWKRRERDYAIVPRMYTVSIKDAERFYLRVLLLHVPGATSYEYLRIVDGVLYSTFKEAAEHRNLVSSDAEWERCLREAATFQMPKQMRRTFAYICIYSDGGNWLKLWNDFHKHMILDFQRNNTTERSIQLALHDLQSIFAEQGLTCHGFGLPTPTGTVEEILDHDRTEERLNAERLIPTLNAQQRDAFDQIIAGIDNPDSHKLFFLNGPGGSGKTYLYSTLISFLLGRGQKVSAFATTGIASTLMKNGTTVHSGFKLPIRMHETSTSYMKQGTSEARALYAAALIIIDEITGMIKDSFRCIDLLLCTEIMKNNIPFGGKVVVIGGDWRQTLPIVPRGKKIDILRKCIKPGDLWDNFKQLSLISNMRSAGQNEYNQWLLDIGAGNTPQIDGLSENAVEIPSNMITVNDIVEETYGQNVAQLSIEELSRRGILCSTNKHSLTINGKIIDEIPGDEKTYYSSDSIQCDDPSERELYPIEFINGQTPSGTPPHILTLKVGAIVMLLRNLSRKNGLCNGTRMMVRGLQEHFITCEIISECHRGDIIFISRLDITPSETLLPFKLKRRQFPIIPAFAMTINKSQGQTFDLVGVYLTEPVFGHGQLYVALSRSRNPNNIKIFINDDGRRQGRLLHDDRWFTENIVYREIFD